MARIFLGAYFFFHRLAGIFMSDFILSLSFLRNMLALHNITFLYKVRKEQVNIKNRKINTYKLLYYFLIFTVMLNDKKIVVVLPAYNAALTLEKTYCEIPFDIVDD